VESTEAVHRHEGLDNVFEDDSKRPIRPMVMGHGRRWNGGEKAVGWSAASEDTNAIAVAQIRTAELPTFRLSDFKVCDHRHCRDESPIVRVPFAMRVRCSQWDDRAASDIRVVGGAV
jgi:hypothetical protein